MYSFGPARLVIIALIIIQLGLVKAQEIPAVPAPIASLQNTITPKTTESKSKSTLGNLATSLDWEFGANNVYFWWKHFNFLKTRGKQHQDIQHFEIPLRLMSYSYENQLSPEIRDSLLFTKVDKDGQQERYVRWIINPEDTKYHKQLRRWLVEQKVDAHPKKYFRGHLTASRSIYLEDPIKGTVFSAKVGTNRTGGNWTSEKNLDLEQVLESEHAGRLATHVARHGLIQHQHLRLMNEPLGLFIQGEQKKAAPIQQGMIVRDLSLIQQKDHYYLPGFAALNERVGREIALKNGASDVQSFWIKNYIEVLGKTFAELAAHYGLAVASAHNQQFLIELDKDYKPTGKIVVRDFNDSNALGPFLSSGNERSEEFLKDFTKFWDHDGSVYKKYFTIFFGSLYSIVLPSWINEKDAPLIATHFFDSFNQHFSSLTGVSLKELQRSQTEFTPTDLGYSTRTFLPLNKKKSYWSKGWRTFFQYAECFRGATHTSAGELCAKVLKRLAKRAARQNQQQEKEQLALSCVQKSQQVGVEPVAPTKQSFWSRLMSKLKKS